MKFVPFRSVFPRLANERGVVLVVVLWLFIFLFVVALDFSATMREDAVAAQRFGEDVEGYYLALAGLTEGLYDLLQQPTQGGQSGPLQELADGVWTDGHLGTGLYRVRLVDEGGKININRADEGLLRRVFTNLGIEEQRVHTIVDSILDWRDADDLHRVNGAENEYYLAQAYPYSARNGPFDMIEDLLWVRGVSPELFYGLEEDGVKRSALKDVFTVDSQLARVNLRTARAPILHALLGVPLQEAERFVEERRNLSEKTFADLVRLLAPSASGLVQQYFVFVSPSVVSIEAAGVHEGSQTERRIKAVVRLTGANRNVEILRWLDEDSGSENRKQE